MNFKPTSNATRSKGKKRKNNSRAFIALMVFMAVITASAMTSCSEISRRLTELATSRQALHAKTLELLEQMEETLALIEQLWAEAAGIQVDEEAAAYIREEIAQAREEVAKGQINVERTRSIIAELWQLAAEPRRIPAASDEQSQQAP